MSQDLDIETIYQYDHHTNIPWNIVEYDPLRQYHGKSTAYSTNRYVTKKGFYMDNHIKIVKDLPSPDKYPTKSGFDQSENIKQGRHGKINPRVKKNTYLDDIELQGKKHKLGVGAYSLQKTQKQIDQENKRMQKYTKTSHAQRPSFFEDVQVLSGQTPGSGCYNPHLSVSHIKDQRMTPENWRNKHKKQSKQYIKKKRKQPGPFSYRPASAGTFDRLELDTQRDYKKKNKSLNKGFGTDAKFEYCRKSKKKIIQTRPDPTKYDLRIPWNGKKDQTKKHGWNSFISTRSNSFSVYNCY